MELSDAIDRIGRMIEQEEVLAREAAYHDERRRALEFVLEALRSRLA